MTGAWAGLEQPWPLLPPAPNPPQLQGAARKPGLCFWDRASLQIPWASLVAQRAKTLPTTWET